jgi:hypothetical protein
MKTNNLQKKSFLMTMILAMSAGFAAITKGGSTQLHGSPNGFIGGGSPIYTPRRGMFKGYMRENRRSTWCKRK